MTEDKRQHSRLPVELTVEVSCPGRDAMVLRTRDISDSGVFLQKGEAELPAVGTELRLKVTVSLSGDDPPVVKARVVRATDDGIGISFEGGDDPPS